MIHCVFVHRIAIRIEYEEAYSVKSYCYYSKKANGNLKKTILAAHIIDHVYPSFNFAKLILRYLMMHGTLWWRKTTKSAVYF